MPLSIGDKLGPYEILAPIGKGGMGEVYRARDTRLNRDVALKVLPQALACDPERMARSEREAKVLASLNHPNIACIYGLEESDSTHALVMELVEGPTLAEVIARSPIPFEEALLFAKQLAEALEYAHERGIIHRDLKPLNIKLTSGGQLKVLDFGLAKVLENEVGESNISSSPTISEAATRAGVLLGTAAYMSPDQARGKAVDRRTDIWAFGCVMYEMITGKPAFAGETITDTLAAVVRAEPDWSRVPERTPQRIRELLRRCLQKHANQRLQAIGDARIELEQFLAEPAAEIAVPGPPPTQTKMGERLAWFVALVGTAAALWIGTLHWSRPPEKARVVRSYIKAMPNSSFVFSASPTSGFALSPDGLRLAYVAQNAEGKAMLWVRPLDSLQAQVLAGTQDGSSPFWSPDSRHIGFFADGKLKRIEASGGSLLTLCDAPNPRGGTWSQEGVILFSPSINAPLYRISDSGGAPTAATSLDTSKREITHRWPQFLPDGHHFLYLAGAPFGLKENPTNAILVGSLDSKENKLLLHTHASAKYASGHILYLRQNTLMAQPFDEKRLELTGDAFPIADPVQEEDITLRSLFSISQNGLLAYVEGIGNTDRELIWVDRKGNKVGGVPDADAYRSPRISPDGRMVMYTLVTPGDDIWTYDLTRGVKTRLTFGFGTGQGNMDAVWSPDGQRIAYTSIRDGRYNLFQKAADGSGSEELLLEGTEYMQYPDDWSPDGRILAFHHPFQGSVTISALPLGQKVKPYPLLQSQSANLRAAFSPDGKWLAYCSNESGDLKVYVVPFPGPGGKWQVSLGGGDYPRWRRDGKELFYLSLDNKIMAVEVKASGSSFAIGTVKPLFETRPYRSVVGTYDVTADGQRFIIAYEPGQPNAAISLVENWDAALSKK